MLVCGRGKINSSGGGSSLSSSGKIRGRNRDSINNSKTEAQVRVATAVVKE